jgi:hypothetical protein
MIGFFLAFVAAIQAAPPASGAPVDRSKVAALMQHTIDAGRAALRKASGDPRVKPDDLHDAEAQFALILIDAGRCPDAIGFVKDHPGVMAARIDRLIRLTLRKDDDCAIALARLMLERWNDTGYTTDGRIAARFLAAAYLDGAGDGAAARVMAAADAELQRMPDQDMVWQTRRDAIIAYPVGDARSKYLDYIAERLLAEEHSPFGSTWRDFLIDFAQSGRCDLIQKVTKRGPESCVEPEKIAKEIDGLHVTAGMKKWAEAFAAPYRVVEDIPLDDKAIDVALAGQDLWGRMTRLLLLTQRCRAELTES